MDERELEQRLRMAVEHAAPDPLNEEGMPYGAATYAYCAEQWLTRHADD